MDMAVDRSVPIAAAAVKQDGRGAALRALLPSVLAFAFLCVLQSLAEYRDALALSRHPDLLDMLRANAMLYMPWAAFTVAQYAILARSRWTLTRPAVFCALLAVSAVLFILPYEVYQVLLRMAYKGLPLEQFSQQLARHPAFIAYIDFFLFLGSFSFVYAVVVFQRAMREEQRQRRVEAENLSLRLELEQGRLAALQAQLEPHFMFNALNALGALVRGGEQSLALSAIQRLSELLRYAIAASGKEWVGIGEEVAFVEDYVGLQKLRFGERLQFRVEGLESAVLVVECPPLLLQPLVENALRHHVEVSTAPTDVRLCFVLRERWLDIRISNPMGRDAGGNRGLGIGLKNISDRLALAYGRRARFNAATAGDEFIVEIRIPRDPDSALAIEAEVDAGALSS